MKKGILLSIPAALTMLMGAEEYSLDAVSVTATKFERETKEVPQSVSVVDNEEIEDRNVLNVKDAIETIPGVITMSKNNGYDSRLIIRGAGLKARYGIREIMVMRDGVPMTDPDSFTRMDFIDVDDMESVEVFKGPGSIAAANASGGVVFIKSKSVFDTDNNRVKIGYGTFDTLNANIKGSFAIDESNYVGVSVSRRQSNNSWREWNEFDTTQASLKYGHLFEDDASLQMEFAYTEANLQLPQSLSADEFAAYKETGETTNTNGAWQQSGRYSDTYFFNVQYEKSFGDLTFKPQAYFTKWGHYHPVTGMINDAPDNYVVGTDLAFDAKHTLFDRDASLVFGLTARSDIRDNSKKYTYRDYIDVPGPSTRIIKVTSDEKGDLAGVEDGTSTLYGFYVQESFSPAEKLLVDVGLRYDHLSFDIDGTEYLAYDYADGNYTTGEGDYSVAESYDLFSPKIGATYALTETLNLYGLVASANQAPTDSEVRANLSYGSSPSLKSSTSINYEVGLKQRSRDWSMDLSLYYNDVRDEIVAVKGADNTTYYTNAGKTKRLGAELSLNYLVTETTDLGATGSWYDYSYDDYVDSGVDYSGNKQRYIPDYQYSLFAAYHDGSLSARIEGISYGPFYMDDLNTEKYDGFTLVTNLSLAYTTGHHRYQFNVNNLFDQRYATEVDKTTGYGAPKYYYTPGMPQFAMLTYTYSF
ncbi:TonB-dependent receptor [Sulfurimonas sp. HSL-1656]|uniref:TonB-dependent receptor n=1 Tax=Thiomicrolovo subterrani TaxID=3131934 RepID=UPI0031F76E8C